MKVFMTDKFSAAVLERVRALGFDLVYHAEIKGQPLLDELKASHADALVVRSTKVTAAMMDANPKLSLIVRAGSGFDNVDVSAAAERGIYVSNCPGKNSIAVAELAVGLMVALDRRIADNVVALRAHQWNKKEFSQSRGLFGRTLGVLGMGNIGQLVTQRAQAFGMRVVSWTKDVSEAQAQRLGVELLARAEDVAAVSDVVTVHLALTPETRGICGPTFFEAMRPGAFFINTSRGEVVDELALRHAVEGRGIRAGLDVFADEPAGGTGTITNALVDLPGVYGTHHIGASTEQAQEAIADETVRVLVQYRDTGRVPNVVNVAQHTPATHVLSVRHHDRVGVLAHVLNGLRAAGVNVQEMENVVFAGAKAAIARIHLDRPISASVLDQIQTENPDIMELKLLSLKKA